MAEPTVAALLAGDEDAFVELVERDGPVLLRLALVHSPSRALAEEAVQETWVVVLRSLHQFDGRSSVRTWMCRIVINEARRRAGRETRSTPVPFWFEGQTSGPTVDPSRFRSDGPWAGHWTSFPLDPAGLPEDRLLSLEVRERIEQAVAGLARRQREVFVLRDVEGWASAEVCAVLDITPGHQRCCCTAHGRRCGNDSRKRSPSSCNARRPRRLQLPRSTSKLAARRRRGVVTSHPFLVTQGPA